MPSAGVATMEGDTTNFYIYRKLQPLRCEGEHPRPGRIDWR